MPYTRPLSCVRGPDRPRTSLDGTGTTTMANDEPRFAFGANWDHFVRTALNDARVASAVASMRRLLRVEDLSGRSVLDIGCGSGLFSLSAHLLGAREVIGFDFDPDSVRASESLRTRFGVAPERWDIRQGSVLDPVFMAGLPSADVVYSWGVLHHTGQMWNAIDAAVSKVKPDGMLAIAIYNKVTRIPDSSAMWWRIKRFYNQSPEAVRRLMELGYASNFVLTRLISLRNPFPAMTDGQGADRRGMDFWHDARDWLGGFPYEYATAGEIFDYLHDRHALQLRSLFTYEGNACNEFVFERGAAGSTPAER